MLRNFFKRVTLVKAPIVVLVLLATPNVSLAGTEACKTNRGLYLLEREARSGDAGAMLYLGKQLLQLGCSEEQRHEGVMWIEKAAEQNSPEALYVLGMLIMAHADPHADVSLAVTYLKRAAAEEHVDAAAFLGAYLMSMSETLAMRDEAFYWLGEAASNGSVVAALTTQQIYAAGLHGVEQDSCSAALWHEAAVLVQHPEIRDTPNAPDACKP